MNQLMDHDFPPAVRFSRKSVLSSIMSSLRCIAARLNVSASLHVFRQLIHFGPWRVVPIQLIRWFRPPTECPIHNQASSLLGAVDARRIAEELRRNSVALEGPLPAEFVNRLRQVTDKLPPNEYQLVHQVNEDVRRLTEDAGIKDVLRAYLKSEPVLLEASLFVSKAEPSSVSRGQNLFHFDYAGWESLNVFVYLTDVTENSSYHVVAKASHRDRRLRDVLRGPLTVEEAQRRYGSAIHPITGPAGTLFFENTEAYHRRHQGNERRVMLNLLYASHRSFLSHGRASRQQIENRDREFQKLAAPGEC